MKREAEEDWGVSAGGTSPRPQAPMRIASNRGQDFRRRFRCSSVRTPGGPPKAISRVRVIFVTVDMGSPFT